ncbi:MAG: hypothetical protein ACUVQ3_02960, partial [bacterium]
FMRLFQVLFLTIKDLSNGACVFIRRRNSPGHCLRDFFSKWSQALINSAPLNHKPNKTLSPFFFMPIAARTKALTTLP